METVSTEGVQKDYAGFWLRFVALLIDSIIITLLYFFIVTPIFAALGFGFATAAEDIQSGNMTEEEALGLIGVVTGIFATVGLIIQIIYILYFALMESSKFQGTVGKMVVGIKVTDSNGGRVSFGSAFIRNLGKILSQIIIYIGFLMAAFTEKKQGLHDMIANTLVLRK
ncbi:MAG: RDD family protein [Bacteroidota bacterium]